MRVHRRSTTAFLILLAATVASTAATSNAAMVQGDPQTGADAAVSVQAVRHGAIVLDFDAEPSMDKTAGAPRFGNLRLDGSAPTQSVFGDYGAAIAGPVVADPLKYSGSELPFTAYDLARDVPELGAYGLIGVAACAGLVLMLRTRGRSRRTWA